MNDSNEKWDFVFEPRHKFFQFDIGELLSYRFLLFLIVRRDFVTQFKQTILGPLWFVVQPVLTSGVFTIIFSQIAKIPTDGVPPFLFNMAGVTLWSYFSGCLTSNNSVLVANAGLFGKVYFPRLIVPLSNVASRLLTFSIQFIFFVIVFLVFWASGANLRPNWWILLVPLLVVHAGLLGMGIGLWASALTIKYRDLNQLIGFGVSLAMYATPIFYSTSSVPESLKWIITINPMAPVVEIFRYAFTGTGQVNLPEYLASLGLTVVMVYIGIALFHRAERTAIDVA